MILKIGPRVECHLARFSAIQTHPSCRFHLAVDLPAVRRGGSWSRIVDQARDCPEQFPRHRHLGQLERDVPAMADNFGLRRGNAPVLGLGLPALVAPRVRGFWALVSAVGFEIIRRRSTLLIL